MNHEIIKRVIEDRIEYVQNEKITEREYIFDENLNYILVGVRRAGKSTMLDKMARKLVKKGCEWSQIVPVNFEDDRLLGFTLQDFDDILETAHERTDQKEIYYFLDEVQNVDGWEHFARRMADQHKRVFITGSNAKMLSRDMESVLGSRYISRMIMPYSFSEVLDDQRIPHDADALVRTSSIGSIRGKCTEYLKHGGLPEVWHIHMVRKYIKSVYEKIILGDIVEREKVKNPAALRLMIKKIAETVMHEVSFGTLAGNVKAAGIRTSTDSMIAYTSYAEDAFLLFRTRNYVSRFAERESIPRFYFIDNGFLSLFLIDHDSAMLGNAVAVYLHRKFEENVWYMKSAVSGIDIDFYLPAEKTAIQVSYSLGQARDRELRSLKNLRMKYPDNADRYIIVTYEEEEVIEENGMKIEVVPAYKFLLGLVI